MKHRILPALLFVILPALAVAADPLVIEVRLESYAFKPDKITVKVGQPVTLKVTNEASFLPHNLIIKAPEAGIDVNVDLRGGKSGDSGINEAVSNITRRLPKRSAIRPQKRSMTNCVATEAIWLSVN